MRLSPADHVLIAGVALIAAPRRFPSDPVDVATTVSILRDVLPRCSTRIPQIARLAEAFISRALDSSRIGAAMLVRTAFLEGNGRFTRLYSLCPPSLFLQFAERVPMVKGRFDPSATTASAYGWMVWDKTDTSSATRLDWIAPCRARLEQAEDALHAWGLA